ncbi:unnamed protein product [Prorocentrum cordatum]|uniref:Uncharacterized protein n=1 Tax=Prorocentrum cordatum TaxID=2364126 RepID=A0ABN9U191_9DINO|nr:unnamed protein product [Polarella glacialis]
MASKVLGPGAGPVAQAQGQVVVCIAVTALLRQVGLTMYRRARERSVMKSVYETMLTGLPWFLRVPMVVVLPAYLEAIYDWVGWSPHSVNLGQASLALFLNLLMFACVYCTLVYLGSLVRELHDATQPDARWSTFFLQSGYLAFMSGSGKCMHYALRILVMSLAGPVDKHANAWVWRKQGRAVSLSILTQTALCWCLLSSTLPNQMESPLLQNHPWEQINLTCQQYVVVYSWAFAVVNAGWDLLYLYVGGVYTSYSVGFCLFCLWLLACLAFSCALAATTPDRSFYNMGQGNVKKAAACLMNYWLVDFTTWWAQAQIMTSLDTGAEDLGKEGALTVTSWPIIGVNFGVVLIALFVCGGVHACNHDALLHKAAFGGGHRQKIFGTISKYNWLRVDDSDDSTEEEESGDGDESS